MFFFFNDTATTEIYTLSLHDALPISPNGRGRRRAGARPRRRCGRAPPGRRSRRAGRRSPPPPRGATAPGADRKSTRLNSSHLVISYAVFCLKKKKQKIIHKF